MSIFGIRGPKERARPAFRLPWGGGAYTINAMEEEGRKLDVSSKEYKKARLIYTIELAFFAIVFAVIGILFIVKVITAADWKKYAFVYVTLVGAVLLFADFGTAFTKRRRPKVSIFDKAIILPASAFCLAFDIYALATGLLNDQETDIFQYVIGWDLVYLAIAYLAEAIYHWFIPHPSLLEPDDKGKKPEEGKPDAAEAPEEKKAESGKDGDDGR